MTTSTTSKSSSPKATPSSERQPGMYQKSAHTTVAVIRFLIPVGVLGFAIAGATWLISARPAPPAMTTDAQATLVETIIPVAKTDRAVVTGYGTVQPFRSLTLQSQVGGQVTEINDRLVIGGMVARGEILFQRKSRDTNTLCRKKVGVHWHRAGCEQQNAAIGLVGMSPKQPR